MGVLTVVFGMLSLIFIVLIDDNGRRTEVLLDQIKKIQNQNEKQKFKIEELMDSLNHALDIYHKAKKQDVNTLKLLNRTRMDHEWAMSGYKQQVLNMERELETLGKKNFKVRPSPLPERKKERLSSSYTWTSHPI